MKGIQCQVWPCTHAASLVPERISLPTGRHSDLLEIEIYVCHWHLRTLQDGDYYVGSLHTQDASPIEARVRLTTADEEAAEAVGSG
jgi:hypothetical protein